MKDSKTEDEESSRLKDEVDESVYESLFIKVWDTKKKKRGQWFKNHCPCFYMVVYVVKVVYYKSRKRDLEIRLMNESRCDERLKVRVQEDTCLTYTGLHDKTNQKYLWIKMRSTSEKSANVMGERTIQTRWWPH
jgi:hypothetical protein